MHTYTPERRAAIIAELSVAAGLLSVGQVHDFDDLSETLACAANMLAAPSTIPEVIRAQEAVYHVCLEKWGAENGVTIDALLVLDHLKTAPSTSLPLTDEQIDSLIAAAPREDCEKEGWIARQRRVWIRAAEAKIKGGE